MARLGIGGGTVVVDLAAGTGKLARSLVATGARIVAVEPSAGMREQLIAAVPSVAAIDGTAEALPLDDMSVDAVVVGQAFHWFDGDRALPEIHRVLRRIGGGGLGMVWNMRDRTADWLERLADLTEPYRRDVPTYRDGTWRDAFDRADLFTPLEHRAFPYEHEVTATVMVERMASISWIASLPDGERAGLLHRVAAIFDGMPDRFPVPYHTDVWWCRAVPR
ncbi:MAG: class I SAM-dependent methyltransferase [Acidimicrobiales bacterium]